MGMILVHHLVRAVASVFRERIYGGHSLSCSAPLLISWHRGAVKNYELSVGEDPAKAFGL
jgi:hypothetical protein